MRKRISITALVAVLLLLVFAPLAMAEGAPPAGAQKGIFTEVDTAARTAVFKPVGSEETTTMRLGDAIKIEDVKTDTKVMISTSSQNGQEVIKDISVMFLGLTGQNFIALLAVGFIGGLLSGFIGSGGAFVLTPSMMSLGVPGAIAVASNMCHKFPKAMVGAHKRNKYGQVDLKLGLIVGVSAIVGVQIGIKVQEWILDTWGSAGSDLYVSVVFVIILALVGAYVFRDAWKIVKSGAEAETSKLALTMQKIKIPPMINFKKAGLTISLWVTVPVGFATGMLAATIAVGGFIGVPGMIYVIGAPALMATATELVVAFVMGFWGSIQWALSGLVDIRLVLIILAASLIGVQLGALGTTYVKDYLIKVVMGTVMLIVAVSRGAKVPVYLSNLEIISLSSGAKSVLNAISFWTLIVALVAAGAIIVGAMVKGMMGARAEEAKNALTEGV